MQDRIVSAIKRELTEGGLSEVSENPDLLVTSHVSSKDDTVYTTTGFGYGGFGPGWGGWGGMGSSMTTSTTYTEGTLVIDGYEPSDKKVVWRGTGTVTVKEKPEKQIQQIDNISPSSATSGTKSTPARASSRRVSRRSTPHQDHGTPDVGDVVLDPLFEGSSVVVAETHVARHRCQQRLLL